MAANTDRIFMAEQIKVRIIFQYYFNTITTTNESPLHITQPLSTATQYISLTSLNNTIFQQQNFTYTQQQTNLSILFFPTFILIMY